MQRNLYRSPEFGFSTLPFKPPFTFPGVVTRVFPLRANPHTLQTFCDGYLNQIPPELGRFKVTLPYVYLMILDYGQMASIASNLGWISQHEIMFSVPLEWYRVVNGQWVFHDWAWTSPFIFVDETLSQSLGRMVYGWPKILAKFEWESSALTRAPGVDERILGARTSVFRKLYAGRASENQVFLSVRRAPTSPLQRMPPDLRSPFSPWMAPANMAQSVTDSLWDLYRTFAAGGTTPPALGDRFNNAVLMARSVAQMFAPVGSDLHFNTVNLKQFRHASNPDDYCYQSVTNTRMNVAAFNGGGLMSGEGMLGADPSGGYSIHLHRYPSLPIIETLGLEVERTWSEADDVVSSLRPVLPFWYDVDLDYNVGYNVAWRTFDTKWHDEWGRVYEPDRPPVPSDKRFNGTLGPSAAPVAGGFSYKGLTSRVLPLKADADTLRAFLDNLLNNPLKHNPDGYHFKLWTGTDAPDATVYLTVNSCESKTPEINNVGSWSEADLSFLVPVTFCGRYKDAHGASVPFEQNGLVPAFTFNSSALSSVIATEVTGVPTTASDFDRPQQKWMAYKGPSPDTSESFLEVSCDLMPILGENQEATRRCLVEVTGCDPTGFVAPPGLGAAPPPEFEFKHTELLRAARAGALDVVGGASDFLFFSLKQLRDIAEPDSACFQALVGIWHSVHPEFETGELPTTLSVRIHEYPTAPIVDQLGLKDCTLSQMGGVNVRTFRPAHPFWLSTSLIQLTGSTLCSRAGDSEWVSGPDQSQFLSEIGLVTADATRRRSRHGLAAVAHAWRRQSKAARPIASAPTGRSFGEVPPMLALRAVLDLKVTNTRDLDLWRFSRGEILTQLDPSAPPLAQASALRTRMNIYAGVPDEVNAAYGAFLGLATCVDSISRPAAPDEPTVGHARLVRALEALFAMPSPGRIGWLRGEVFARLGLDAHASWEQVVQKMDAHPDGDAVARDVVALLTDHLASSRDVLVDLLARAQPYGTARPL